MTELAAQTKRLSPAKRALLDKLLKGATGSSGSQATISRRESNEPAPLSFAQQRLWFFDQLEPQNPFYNISAEVPIEGPLDVDRLEQCLVALIDRHEALRTVFHSEGGEARQIVLPSFAWRLQRIDVTRLPEAKRLAECERLAIAEAERPFDLASGPLFRATLVDLGRDRHRLLLVVHHIVCDGWSMNVMRRELAALYAAAEFPSAGASGKLPLPALSIQFADYAAWQRRRLAGDVLEKQLVYWRSRLGEGSPFLELPIDRPRPLVQSFRGDSTAAHIPRPVIESLKSVCREEQATLFMGLLAAFQTLLARYTGQTDISVGSPIANRIYPEVEPLIGFFANTLVLRADLAGEPTFRELLKQTRETTLGAYAHQETPFERIVDELAPQRDLSRTPLFQVMFVLQNTSSPEWAGGVKSEATGKPRELSVGQPRIGLARTANFELTLNVEETPTGADLLLVYNADLFERSTAERMLAAYLSLLKGIAGGGADQRLSRLPLLAPAEQRRLLTAFNDTDREYPSHLCLHELFTEQAAKTPAAAAVIDEHGSLTYAELDKRSNQLARRLRSLGVKAETPVGICLDRSSSTIVGLLGILKAGGAYVPLDPRYPAERLAFMLGDSRPALVLSRASLAQSLLAGATESHTTLWDIDAEAAAVDAESDEPLPPTVTPDNLAYIIYTSGSTGNPKGVLMHHRGVVNFVCEYVRRVGMGEGDRMLQVVSLSFDASLEEIFTTLSSGAALVMHPAPAEMAPRDLLAYMKRHEVNLLHFPPSLWQGLVDELVSHRARTGEDATDYNFKAFLTGGEPVSPESLRVWDELTGRRVRFVAAYGVTEAAVTTTIYDSLAVDRKVDDDWRPSIGRPIANTRIYVLDSHLQPVPAGAPGELCIGGLGVARGYWNLPGLTAEKFLPDPYSPHAGSRLYRTGDLGRMRSDGSLEFLGRIDSQVKIRGFRIEVGEIETALLKRPEVREAVVVAREDKPGVKRLAAYLTSNPMKGGETSTAELRSFLKDLLPEHMIPASFTWLESLPLTASQKVDRRRLPAPDLSRREGDGGFAAPQTTVEKQLAEIWAGVLGLPHVGIHDNFFELGGDSILTIQVISRAADAGLHFTPKQLFLHQTIAELAPQAAEAPPIAAEQGPIEGPIVATPIQREFFALKLADAQHFNQAVLLTVRERLSPDIVERALAILVEHHDALRLHVAGEDQLTIAPVKAFSMIRHVVGLATEIEAIAASSQAGFELTKPPLLRADWFELPGDEPARLLLAIHHLAVDGVSWRILLEDLGLLCRQLSRNEAPAPFRKTTSIRQWGERLREHTLHGGFEGELDYWLAAPPSTTLPRDFGGVLSDGRAASEAPIASNRECDARSVNVQLSREETHSLLGEASAAYRTQIGDLLLTAVSQTLSCWLDDAQAGIPGDRRLPIDLEGHGREPLFDDVDLSRTVGWFTSLYPIALPLPVEGSRPADDIKAVKETLRAAPAGGVGYGALKWLSADDSRAARLRQRPRAEVSFNYLGQFDQVLSGASLFGLAPETAGPLHSPRQERAHLVEILAHVERGQLQFRWIYNERIHAAATVERLAQTCLESLRRLIEHCLSPDAGGFIPADFPLANIDESDLDALSRLLSED